MSEIFDAEFEEQKFFEVRTKIFAVVKGMNRAEAVYVLTSAINECLAPCGYGATVTLRDLASHEGVGQHSTKED